MFGCPDGRLRIQFCYLAAFLSVVWNCLAWGLHIANDKGRMTTSRLTVRSLAKRAQKACLLLGLSSSHPLSTLYSNSLGEKISALFAHHPVQKSHLALCYPRSCSTGSSVTWLRDLRRLKINLSPLIYGLVLSYDLEIFALVVLKDLHHLHASQITRPRENILDSGFLEQ